VLAARLLEPDLDVVARFGPGDLAAQPVVVDPGLLVVALAVAPLSGVGRLDRSTVDAVLEVHVPHLALGQHLHRLRVAVRVRERVDVEVPHGVAQVRLRVRRVVGGLRQVEREVEVAPELVLDRALVVLELEAGHRRVVRLGALRRVGEDAVAVVGRVERVAVGDVEVGVEALDRRVLVIAGERGVDRVVRGGRVLLPALRIEDQLGGGVIVLLEFEVDHVPQVQHRLRLGLRGGALAAIGLGRLLRRRPFVVEAPVDREVAVGIDAVARLDPGLAVELPQVLAPQAVAGRERELVAVRVVHAPQAVAGRERELVAVRVVHADEPQLALVHQPGDLPVLAVPAREVLQRALARLAGKPLAGVLQRVVEDRRLAVVGALGVARHLDRDDVAAQHRLADIDLRRDVGVLRDDPVVELRVLLVAVVRDGVVLAIDLVRGVARVRRRIDGGRARAQPKLGQAAADLAGGALRAGASAAGGDDPRPQLGLALEPRHLLRAAVYLDPAAATAALRDVEAGQRQLLEVLRRGLHAVGVESARPGLRGHRHGEGPGRGADKAS